MSKKGKKSVELVLSNEAGEGAVVEIEVAISKGRVEARGRERERESACV